MRSTNYETYRAGHDAFNQRDFDAMVKRYADSITWTDRARSLTFRTPQEFKDVFLAGGSSPLLTSESPTPATSTPARL